LATDKKLHVREQKRSHAQLLN